MSRNIFKRIISIVLASFICTQSIFAEGVYNINTIANVNTDNTLTTISVGEIETTAENKITIPINISNNVGLAGLTISVGYNADILTLTKITRGEALSNLSFSRSGDLSLNPIKLLWDGMDAVISNGNIALLEFITADNIASIENLINITVLNACDDNLQDVKVVVQGTSDPDLEAEILKTDTANLFKFDTYDGTILYGDSTVATPTKLNIKIESDGNWATYNRVKYAGEESCIPNKESLLSKTLQEAVIEMDMDVNETESEILETNSSATYSQTKFIFDGGLLSTFNTVTAPIIRNGANEPKFSYNSFLEENISDYSGELTLNFEDLVLEGRNGLDLRIGRTYQTIASNTGENTIMILPNRNNRLGNTLVNNYSTYLLDRYNLGMGWGFSFPSVQIETEYIPKEVVDTYYYDEISELYYHSGNGDVYQVDFTDDDSTDSNLKGYYNKDIQFNKNDFTYSNDKETSYYSMTLADKTIQYFTIDGRLICIRDRFGNEINFEYDLFNTTNRVPGWNFWFSEADYNDDEYMWDTSYSLSDNLCDAYPMELTNIGSDDGYVMYFERECDIGNTYIISPPIQLKPYTEYNLGARFRGRNIDEDEIEIICYDTAYTYISSEKLRKWDSKTDNGWTCCTGSFSTASPVRYIQIKITSDNAAGLYVDSVTLDEQKPLLTKITDTIGRTIEFEYNGDITSGDTEGNVTLTVISPDKTTTRTLIYNKEAINIPTQYTGHDEQRFFWYLHSSSTEGTDGEIVKYEYEGGATIDTDGSSVFPYLISSYDGTNCSYTRNPLLSSVRYKDRMKVYEYEKVYKRLGEKGYYETFRIKKKYDMYGYFPESEMAKPENEREVHFKGELGTVNYSYSGLYNGNSFNNETGYPHYTFNDKTTLNEQWTVTKTGKTTDTATFSNCALVQKTSSSNGTTITSDYTNHTDFKHSPTQIKNTATQNGLSKNTYFLYSYNDWGGVSSETKEVDEETKNNASLLEKYTTTYEYDDTFHFITQKSYYNNIDSPQVHEINEFDEKGKGLLISSQNAAKEKTMYSYDNTNYPFLVTETTMDDPMGFYNMLGGDKVVTYEYDTYGLYPVTISEAYDNGVANTSYEYDYITGDVLKETLPDGSYTEYEYYMNGKIKSVTSPRSSYVDGREFRTKETYSYASNLEPDSYSAEGKSFEKELMVKYLIFEDEQAKKPYQFTFNYYDAVGNLKQSQQGYFQEYDINKAYAKSPTQYYHDTHDRLIKTVDNEEHTTLYTYDGFDRPVTITDSENNIYTYAYDSIQNKVDLSLNGVTESSDRQLMTQYFDLYGNVIENVVYPNNSSQTLSESYEYDLNNNVTSYINANGNKTEYLYDAANRLSETILPNGVKASSTYSVFNKPAFEKIYDAEGNERLARITYRNEKGDLGLKFFNYDERMVNTDRYSSDAKGRITSISKGENSYALTYDESDHLVTSTSGNSQIQRSYYYFGEIDVASNSENITEIKYAYDPFGNLGKKSQNDVYSMYYAYSSLGNIVQNLTPANRLEEYTYTPNGNLDTISSGTKIFDYDYYDTGFVKSITYPNNLKTTYEYDNINRITKITTTKSGSVINLFEYEYDNNGNTTKEIRNGAVTSYSYDSLDRLISVTYSDGSSVSYEYDALNNRTKETYSNGDIKDYVYDEKYQLKQIKLNGQVTDTFTYNKSGAVITHNNKTYAYDEWDRMSGYSDGTNTYTYKYDANGIRTQKNDKQYIIDINNNVVAETDSTGAITDEILWGHQPLARKTNAGWYYYIYNAHGDVVGLVDDAGTVVNTYEYTPWGEIRSETEAIDNPIKYAGEYYDDELNMVYLRARYYDPKIGRFTSHDIEEGEISNPLDMNRYVYCRNNPIKYVDPSGESVVLTCIILGAVVGAVAGGFAGAAVSKKTTGSVSGTSVAIGILGGATVGGLLGWGFYAFGASVSAAGLVSTAPGLYKTLDQGVNFAAKALQHMNEKARQVPIQVLIEAIKYGTATPDPRGGSGTMYYIEMVKNGTTYTLEVLYDKATNMIQHFMYYHK